MSGFEAFLAAAAFPAASVQTIKYLVEFGRYLEDKIETYRNADEITTAFKERAADLYRGELSGYMTIAETMYRPGAYPLPKLETTIKGHLKELFTLLKEADKLLEVNLDENGKARSWKMTTGGKKEMTKCANKLEKWRSKFIETIKFVKIQREAEITVNRLDSSKCNISGSHQHTIELEPDSGTSVVQCQLLESTGTRRFLAVLEEKIFAQDGNGTGLDDVISQLAAALREPSTGTLSCIGWRRNPARRYELVFEVPQGHDSGASLWQTMQTNRDKGYGGGHSLTERLKLAHQLSEAIGFVHKKFLVHKNVRSRSIVVLNKDQEAGIGHAFLLNWSMVRKRRDLTLEDPVQGWERDLYRHPTRNSPRDQRPDEDYNTGHDIYSLGVVLLEIGLWEPLIVCADENAGHTAGADQGPIDRSFQLSDTIKSVARDLGFDVPDQTGMVLEPEQMQRVLLATSKSMLPPRTGSIYADVVSSCLSCLEDRFGSNVDFEDMSGDIVGDFVLKKLAQIVT